MRLCEGRQQSGPVGAVDVAHVEVGTEGVDRGGRELFGDEHDGLRHVVFPSVAVREGAVQSVNAAPGGGEARPNSA